jgi:hypothetical protein
MRRRAWIVSGLALLFAGAPILSVGARDSSEGPPQTRIVRTTGGIDTTGWVLIAVLHGPDAAVVEEGQLVRAFSINARTRLHLARVTRVIPQQDGVRAEAKLEARVLGTSTRYLMEIVTEAI